MKKLELKLTPRYCVAFYCIIMLYASLHELVHHFVTAIVCGEFGYKSFNSFEAACQSENVYLFGTLSGPLFSFIVMYIGAYFVSNGKNSMKQHLGFAMIFAQLPMQRMTGPLLRQNDEWWAVIHLWGRSEFNWWMTLMIIWVICLPPLIVAFRAISNRFRILWFLFYFLLFPYLLFGPFFFLLEYLMLKKEVLSSTILGVGWLFIVNELITIALYFKTKKFIHPGYQNIE